MIKPIATINCLIMLTMLAGCVPEDDAETDNIYCTSDGWQANTETGEILTGADGAAIECEPTQKKLPEDFWYPIQPL